MSALQLKKLSNVYIRKRDVAHDDETGIQRGHESERSEEIRRFLVNGYPLSESKSKFEDADGYADLLMPGWLPTAIIANILPLGAKRNGSKLLKTDQIEVIEEEGKPFLYLPEKLDDPNWDPLVHPMEIIDGQHRLWAFDEDDPKFSNYELPVVAFCGLDLSWQAYLFYTINIKPKKINRSLAYDLIPMLRVEEWLERSFDKANVYKETRAQEIVESLWGIPGSPWHNRINMLGERKNPSNITQAAFIRNLIATFFKSGTPGKLGGLFGSRLHDTGMPLDWNRSQQIAFIFFLWDELLKTVQISNERWIQSLNGSPLELFDGSSPSDSTINKLNKVFFGKYSLISTDQGVRGILHVFNDFIFYFATEYNIRNIFPNSKGEILKEKIDNEVVKKQVANLKKDARLSDFVSGICETIVKFDWRTSSFEGLSEVERRNQMIYKGGSGYKELRIQLIGLFTTSEEVVLSRLANKILVELGHGG
jgi:DGQHR domain-containing protein